MSNEINFFINGNDLKKLNAFKRRHKECFDKYPNMTGAQFEYRFIPDGMGIFKTVTCSCGKSISLTNDYNMFLESNEDESFDIEKPVHICPEDERIFIILEWLMQARKHPELFNFNKGSYKDLSFFVRGLSMGANLLSDESSEWYSILDIVDKEFIDYTKDKRYSDQKKYNLWLDILFKRIKKDYPRYALDLGLL